MDPTTGVLVTQILGELVRGILTQLRQRGATDEEIHALTLRSDQVFEAVEVRADADAIRSRDPVARLRVQGPGRF